MPSRIDIPVEVSGSEEAQRELRQVGQDVRDVGQASSQAAGGQRVGAEASREQAEAARRAGANTRDAAKSVNQFDDSAKTAVTGILGAFNPALASLGNIAVDVVKGFSAMSGALLGTIAAGAGIAGLITLVQQFAESTRQAAERLRELRRVRLEQRGEGLSFEESVRGSLREAGVLGGSFESAQRVADLVRALGVGQDVATFIETARRVQPGLGEQQLRTIGGAFLLRGQQDRFTRDQAENRRLIERLLRTDPERVAEALAIDAQERGDAARQQVPPAEAFDRPGRSLDTVIAQIAAREGLNEQDAQRLRDLLAGDRITPDVIRRVFRDRISPGEVFLQGDLPRALSGSQFELRRSRLAQADPLTQLVLQILEAEQGELPERLTRGQRNEAVDLAVLIDAIRGEFPEGGTRDVQELIRLAAEGRRRQRRSQSGATSRAPLIIDQPEEEEPSAPAGPQADQAVDPEALEAGEPDAVRTWLDDPANERISAAARDAVPRNIRRIFQTNVTNIGSQYVNGNDFQRPPAPDVSVPGGVP